MLATVTLPDKAPTADGEKVTFKHGMLAGRKNQAAGNSAGRKFRARNGDAGNRHVGIAGIGERDALRAAGVGRHVAETQVAALELSSAAAATPVPLTETVLGVLEASLMTETLPLTAPAALGANTIVNVDCLPGATVMGSLTPVMENPLAVVLACVTLSAAPPGLDTVTD